MPYTVYKVRNKNCWEIKNNKTGVLHSKCTTKSNADKQVKLLNMMDHRVFAHKKSKMKMKM
jgi:hypothetical protein